MASGMRRLSNIILNQQPLLLPQKATVEQACQRMYENKLGCVLVVTPDDQLVGIFTGRDVVQRVVAVKLNAANTPLEAVMTPNPNVMNPEDNAIEALRLMWDGGFRHIPVVGNDRIMGVVTRSDFRDSEKEQLEDERELWEHMR